MNARVRPSASCTRRKIIAPVSSSPLSLRMLEAGWPFGTSNTAVTWPCSPPWRTRPASPRPPSPRAPRPPSPSAKASSRMDLPAPVSPVSTARPRENSISSRSIRTMSRIDRRASMRDRFLPETQFLEGFGDIGALILARLETAGLYKIIGVLVPAAVRKVVPKYRGGGLGFADDADRHIGLGEPGQGFLDVPGGLILRDYGLEAIDGGRVVALFHVIAADVHFATGELVAGAFELGLGADGIFRCRIFANHLFKRRDRLLGTSLVAGDVGNLVVMGGGDQILGVGRVRASRVQGHVAGRRPDAAVIVAGVVEGVGRHQQRFARPVGVRMLAIDLLEFLRGAFRILSLVHHVQALIVELVRGLLDKGVVLGQELVPQRAGAASAQRHRNYAQPRDNAQLPAEAGCKRSVAKVERRRLCGHSVYT